MQKKSAYCYNSEGAFIGVEQVSGGFLPNNATWVALDIERPFPKNKWPIFNKTTKTWELISDFRERKTPGYCLPEEEQAATEYWLPGDTWETPGRKMLTLGDLPEDATTTKPEKPIELVTSENFDSLRSARDSKIAATDYMLLPDSKYSDEDKEKIQNYRQALRDLPSLPGAPWDGGGEQTPWPDFPELES